MTASNTLQISVNGELWWGGFTAEITVRNASEQPLDSWSTSFISAHDLDPEAWGVEINQEPLGNGLSRYTLRGTSWGQSIPAGGEIRVGFNGSQSFDLGRDGALTEAMLITERSLSESVMADGGAHASEHPAEHAATSHGHSTVPGGYTDITTWGSFHSSNHNSEHNELVGGRTAITTEALVAYNGLRAFAGLEAVTLEDVGRWAFAEGLTNNSQAWGNDLLGVGLWYAMQGAKVGWIADSAYQPQLLADLQRTARLGSSEAVMSMVREVSHDGFADFLISQDLQEAFINTLKMEPHYGGWMHGRTHGFLPIENGAIAHDINHLTVLGWDQNQPFMNDTFDWPQWPALEVSDNRVINYFQSMVALGAPLESNLDDLGTGAPTPPSQPEPESPAPAVVGDSEISESVVSDAGPWEDTNPESTTTNPDPLTGVDVEVSGQLWWGGLTASLAVTNTSDQTVENWGVQFSSDHRFYGEAWGVNVDTQALEDGGYLYEVSGVDWGQTLAAGQTIHVGFNALTGITENVNIPLTEALLVADGSAMTVI